MSNNQSAYFQLVPFPKASFVDVPSNSKEKSSSISWPLRFPSL